jgi:hypothetical protein
VVLLKIDPYSVVAIEFEGDAPWTVDVHGEASRSEAPKGVKVKTRQVQLLGSGRHIKTIKPDKNALVNFWVNLRRPAGRPEVGKGLALERLDHAETVSYLRTSVN